MKKEKIRHVFRSHRDLKKRDGGIDGFVFIVFNWCRRRMIGSMMIYVWEGCMGIKISWLIRN